MGVVSVLTCNRTFLLDEAGKTIPSNMFWGTHEMRQDGEEVYEIAPALMLAQSRMLRGARRLLGAWIVYVVAIWKHRRQINRHRCIYTITHVAAMAAVVLKSLGLIDTRVSLLLIGAGAMDSRGPFGYLVARGRRWAYSQMQAIIFTTRLERDQFRKLLGKPIDNTHFFPFGIDLNFYRTQPGHDRSDSILVIGNDQYRDWKTSVEIARACPNFQFRFITKERNLAGMELPPNVVYLGDPPFAASRDEFERSRVVLICSHPSPYFSGNTTIFAAMVAGAVVVADEDKSAADCHLISGENWLHYPRRNVEAAVKALSAVIENPVFAEGLVTHAQVTVEQFGIERFARAVAKSL